MGSDDHLPGFSEDHLNEEGHVARCATTSHIDGIDLERAADGPLHRQIDRAFRRAILEGRLSGGSRISSSRTLAERLGVSWLTVVSAFEQLISEGYLESRGAGSPAPAESRSMNGPVGSGSPAQSTSFMTRWFQGTAAED